MRFRSIPTFRWRTNIMSRAVAVLILPLFLAACSDTPATAAADGKQSPKAPSAQAAALPSDVTQPDATAVTGTVA
jgi:PBP1b-binding outer membrane lipoprotein LpoB